MTSEPHHHYLRPGRVDPTRWRAGKDRSFIVRLILKILLLGTYRDDSKATPPVSASGRIGATWSREGR